MSLSKLIRSTAFRWSFLFTTLFCLELFVLFSFFYLYSQHEFIEHSQSRICEIRDSLVTIFRSQGFLALRNAVNQRVKYGESNTIYILLVDKKGRFVAGNRGKVKLFKGWSYLPQEKLSPYRKEEESKIFAIWTSIPNGHLLVGHSNHFLNEVRELILYGLGIGLLLAFFFALLFGCFLGYRTQLQLYSIQESLSSVSKGKLQTRVIVGGLHSELDEISKSLNTMLQKLEDLVDGMREVSNNIAHDLKTPLNRMHQRLQMTLRNAKFIEDYRSSIIMNIEDLNSIVATFEALLRIAQIESGARKSGFSEVNLYVLLQDVFDIYEAVAEDSGYKMHFYVEEADLFIRGDFELLTQMFSNLIENALCHCPKGTSISIYAKKVQKYITVTISDNGMGIPKDERSNVLRKLYRLDKSRTTPGSGLGLSMVNAIVNLHGSTIHLCDNCPGLRVEILFHSIRPDLRLGLK